ALGAAGSGKSALLQGIFGYDAARKSGQVVRPSGRFNAQVAFDTKDGASAAEYVAWAQAAGLPIVRTRRDFEAWVKGPRTLPPVVVLTVADTRVPADPADAPLGLDLFPGSGDSMNRARRAVGALKYTFGAQS